MMIVARVAVWVRSAVRMLCSVAASTAAVEIVEHQDRRAEQDAAGDRQALALAARERDAALADQGLVALGQARDVVVQARDFAGVRDPVAIGPGIAVGDVVLDRGCEQEGVLLDQADRPAQGGERDLAHVLAVDRDPAGADVVVARDQVGDGRLAAARRAHDPERPASLHLEADVVQGRQRPPLAGIGEIDMLEAEHRALDHEIADARAIGDVGLAVEDLEQALAGHRGAGERVDHHAELAHRHLQERHEGEIFGERADGDLARQHLAAADPEQEPHGEEVGVGHGGGVADPQIGAVVGERQRVLRHGIELGELIGLGCEGADHPDAAEVLLHHPGQHAEFLLECQPARAQAQPGDHRAPGGERHEAQRDQAERRLVAQEQRRPGADQDGRQHEADDAGVDHRADALDVEHAAGDQLARVHPVVEAEAEALQLGVVGHAQVVGDLLPDRLALVVLPHREQAAQHRGAEQQGRGLPERGARGRRVAAAEQALRGIDGAPEILRDHQLKDRGHDRAAEGCRHAASMVERHAQHAAQDLEVGATDADGLGLGSGRQGTGGGQGQIRNAG